MCNIKITLQPNDVKSDDLERDKLKANFATLSNQLQHDLDITVTLVEEQRNAMYSNPRAFIARYALGPVEVILQSSDSELLPSRRQHLSSHHPHCALADAASDSPPRT